MPGTIQVTVLEFKGVSSSPKPSAKSLKVSMGKRQFQTWDKGDFSFPITKLGEDLVVSLLDAGGNEIAHQDIRTMQIIEKGNWDEVFDINGGGHVHMKLRFFLSEEERHRIRLMRESAVKKKLETNPNIKLRLLQVPDSVETSTKNEQKILDSPKGISDIDEMSPEVEVSQAGSSLASATSSANLSETALIPVKELSDATEKHELISESPQLLEIVPYEPLANVRSDTKKEPPSSNLSDNKTTVAPKLLNDHPTVDKTPSNVRKMISAFESSQIQEVKSLKKVSSVPAQRKDNVLSEDQESKADNSLTNFEDHVAETVDEGDGIVPSQAPRELSSTEIPTPSVGNDLQTLKVSAVDLTRQSTSETATISGRMPEEQTRVNQPYNELSSMSINSSVVEGTGRGTSLKSSTIIVASNQKPTPEEYSNEECYSGQTSDNTRRLCITTAGHHQNEAKTHKGKKISSEPKNAMHETEFKSEKKKKKIVDNAEAGSGSSPNGLVGQVIKIGVIICFGVLVLLTRQKEPRYVSTTLFNLVLALIFFSQEKTQRK